MAFREQRVIRCERAMNNKDRQNLINLPKEPFIDMLKDIPLFYLKKNPSFYSN